MCGVGLFKFGGPEVLKVIDLPEVHAGRGQVRIRNHAAMVNPTDTLLRSGARAEQMKADPPPHEKLDRLRQLVDEGKITLRVAAAYKPEEAPKAHRRLEARGTRGRIVIPSERRAD
jgi:NADPH:quinone reductase-like Zn-dependent oxidoreductase